MEENLEKIQGMSSRIDLTKQMSYVGKQESCDDHIAHNLLDIFLQRDEMMRQQQLLRRPRSLNDL